VKYGVVIYLDKTMLSFNTETRQSIMFVLSGSSEYDELRNFVDQIGVLSSMRLNGSIMVVDAVLVDPKIAKMK
jgi:hypothetical protein